MAKKGKRSAKRKTRSSRKKKAILSLRRILFLVVVVGLLFVGDQLGIIEVDWQELYKQGELILKEQLYKYYRPMKPAVEPVSGEWYRLYFTTPRYPDKPANRVRIIEQGLIEVIDNARQSLDIAIYELNLELVAEAILAAQDRGVRVRMVTDSDSLKESEALRLLKKNRVPLVADERSAIMHNKFVIVDQQAVWTGSWNFTVNGTFRNNNHAIYIQSTNLAENYTTEFEEMFERKAFGPTSPKNTFNPRIQLGETLIETCFAPEDKCADQLVQILDKTQQSIRFMAFAFAHDGIGQAVRDRARASVMVQGVFETSGSETEHSEFGRMKSQQLDVLQDGNPYILHHKVFILDDNTVVLGSFNFSDSADQNNDENFLIIHNADIARQFLSEFERVYTEARHPPG